MVVASFLLLFSFFIFWWDVLPAQLGFTFPTYKIGLVVFFIIASFHFLLKRGQAVYIRKRVFVFCFVYFLLYFLNEIRYGGVKPVSDTFLWGVIPLFLFIIFSNISHRSGGIKLILLSLFSVAFLEVFLLNLQSFTHGFGISAVNEGVLKETGRYEYVTSFVPRGYLAYLFPGTFSKEVLPARGTFDNSNVVATFIDLFYPTVCAFFLYYFRLKGKMFLTFCFLLMLSCYASGIIVTYSRGSLMIMLLVTFFIFFSHPEYRHRMRLFLALLLPLVLGVFLYALKVADTIATDFNHIGRAAIWMGTLLLLYHDDPLNLFVGGGYSWFNHHTQMLHKDMYYLGKILGDTSAWGVPYNVYGELGHSGYIILIVSSGFIGLFFFLRAVFSLMKRLYQIIGRGDRLQTALAASIFFALVSALLKAVVDAPFGNLQYFYIFFILLGVGEAICLSFLKEKGVSVRGYYSFKI